MLSGKTQVPTWSSDELVAPVIDSLVTGTHRELPLNLPNNGQCPDLPNDAVVESICIVDVDGMRGRDTPQLPAPVAELLRRQVATQELTVEAAVSGDRRLAEAAFELDPLAGRGRPARDRDDGRRAPRRHRRVPAGEHHRLPSIGLTR